MNRGLISSIIISWGRLLFWSIMKACNAGVQGGKYWPERRYDNNMGALIAAATTTGRSWPAGLILLPLISQRIIYWGFSWLQSTTLPAEATMCGFFSFSLLVSPYFTILSRLKKKPSVYFRMKTRRWHFLTFGLNSNLHCQKEKQTVTGKSSNLSVCEVVTLREGFKISLTVTTNDLTVG